MAETDRIFFSLKEVSEVLVKKHGIHEGLWGLSIEFGLAANNIPTGAGGESLSPAAITIIQRIGIQRFETPNSMTVDAAEVNPAPKGAKKASGEPFVWGGGKKGKKQQR